jgi:lysylphosphatidylglycerol synthase-like protein
MTASTSRRSLRRGLSLALLIIGAWLFVRSVRSLGADGIRDGLARVGWGLFVVLLLSGLREVMRTLAWRRTIEGGARPTFARAFQARLAGEALSTLLPIGMLVGEPAKAAQVGPEIPFAAAFGGLVVEFAFYTLSLVPVMIAGALTFMIMTEVRLETWTAFVVVTLATTVIIAAVAWLASGRSNRPRVFDRVAIGSVRRTVAKGLARSRHLATLVFGFGRRCPEQLFAIGAYETAYQVLDIAEVYVVLWLVRPHASMLASAVVLETVGRLVTIVFQAVPMRVGVDETGAALMAARLGLGAPVGVTLALVRKLRLLFWTAVGLPLIVRVPAIKGARFLTHPRTALDT